MPKRKAVDVRAKGGSLYEFNNFLNLPTQQIQKLANGLEVAEQRSVDDYLKRQDEQVSKGAIPPCDCPEHTPVGSAA